MVWPRSTEVIEVLVTLFGNSDLIFVEANNFAREWDLQIVGKHRVQNNQNQLTSRLGSIEF